MELSEKIPIGVSSCLLGEEVRYDGGHKNNSYITKTLNNFFEFQPFCPEVSIGLGIPRKPIRLELENDTIRCVEINDPSQDYAPALQSCADDQKHWHQKICGYILKKGSPSCGMERVKLYKNSMPQPKGQGIYAKRLQENFPNLPVEEEGRLGDPVIRENFIHRVIVYRRWQCLFHQDLTLHLLTHFHGQHKYILMSHDQNLTRDLGKKLSAVSTDNIECFISDYFGEFMRILTVKATRKNHVNVLQHIQGYLKKELDKDDKHELTETIEQYRLGNLPLIVPITLLRHHFRKCPNEYINESYYMNPHPQELMLLNSL